MSGWSAVRINSGLTRCPDQGLKPMDRPIVRVRLVGHNGCGTFTGESVTFGPRSPIEISHTPVAARSTLQESRRVADRSANQTRRSERGAWSCGSARWLASGRRPWLTTGGRCALDYALAGDPVPGHERMDKSCYCEQSEKG